MVVVLKCITVRAPVNIAVIKYWGKKDENLMIPLNDSISGTLCMEQLCARTTIAVSGEFTKHQMWLNGHEESLGPETRMARCIGLVKEMVGDAWPDDQCIRICSENNFPTAAGLASSAAGFACFAYALCNLFGITNVQTISTIARSGSGSACRSVYGGFVHWMAGHSNETSIARQIVDEHHWPEMRVIILVVRDTRKETSSSAGMKLTTSTSTLIDHRASVVVPQRTEAMKKALHDRDWHNFAQLTMKDSNSFHSVCLDTFPPIRYMNDISWAIVSMIHFYNEHAGTNVAYTFDAGPNACLYLHEHCLPQLMAFIRSMFPSSDGALEVKGIAIPTNAAFSQHLQAYAHKHRQDNALKYVISTTIGHGPDILSRKLEDDVSLISVDGQPKL